MSIIQTNQSEGKKNVAVRDTSKSEKLPALHFYPGDWKKDLGVQSLDFHDRHVWFEMLLLMHESEERGVLVVNGYPITTEMLARLLGLDNQILSKSLENIKKNGVCGVREDGALYSRRMVRDEELRSKRIYAGSKGGNPVLVKQKSTKIVVEVKQFPEDENATENENEDENKDLKKKKVSVPVPVPVGDTGALEPPPKSEFDTAEARAALARWGQYSNKTLNRAFDQLQADTLMMRYAGRVPDFIRDINGAISSGWRTVRDCASLGAQTFARAGPAIRKEETAFERNMRIISES
jgi:hypothetical protein